MSDKVGYIERMPDIDDKLAWQRVIMEKNYILANHPNPDIAGKALERLARSNPVALYEERVSVSISSLSTEELQLRLDKLVGKIIGSAGKELVENNAPENGS